jgi:hypothetical protein
MAADTARCVEMQDSVLRHYKKKNNKRKKNKGI